MRKLKLQMQLSADGFVCGPNGEMDWMQWNWDEELKNYVNELTSPVDHILLGRKLAEGFIPAWEGQTNDTTTEEYPFAVKMVETPKTVFSGTIHSMPGKNVTVEKNDLVKAVNDLKQQQGGDIIAYGGASFAAALIENDLIDEFHLFYNPSSIGNGLPIFRKRTDLKLISAIAFGSGIVVHHYQRS